ncbi:MAG: PKD domain-containing protein, partial [Victivallales bacterium]|nr:PKD domain-containing protein [Victivallales bacterium]
MDTWYWGDGQTYTCQSDYPYSHVIYHQYRNPGNYSVHVHRSGAPACPVDEYKNVTILENRIISASIATPITGQSVTYTASGFNTPTNITWSMGDGTIYANMKRIISHVYSRPGTYTIRAYDWNGDTTTTPVKLSITVVEPVRAIIYSPATPRVDQEVAIQAVNFQSGTIDWNFGDGTPPQTYSAMVSHRYQNPGSFTITAKEHGMNVTAVTKIISILPENRSLVSSTPEARIGEPVTFTAVNFRGPQVLWDFGDGTVASGPGTIARFGRTAGISGPVTMIHTYELPGSYIVTARDENGVSEKKFQVGIRIIGINDQVNLEIAEITLDNGK